MLVSVISGLWLRAGPILNLDMRSQESGRRIRHGIEYHEAAVAAIRIGDEVAAQTAITEDIRTASLAIQSLGVLR